MGIQLRGMTWNHSRGFVSVVATAQRYSEMHPDVEIVWEKRSLQQFADMSIEQLGQTYDLLVIDHPWAGFAADKSLLVPLQNYLPAAFLADQAANAVGKSHESYVFGAFQSALAIDAATPVASYRKDLMDQKGCPVPQTWGDLLTLAKGGKVAFPGIPIDSLMNFFMLCSTQGEDPCVDKAYVVSREMGHLALEQLRELASYCTPRMFDLNPIRVYETMSSTDDLMYCPFAYGYSNYARPGYAKHVLQYDDLVAIEGFGRLKSTLGGTGLAISMQCAHKEVAVDYVQFTASPSIQRTIFVENGGQPGHRAAWLDAEVNRRTNQYFQSTLPALDRPYLRPRYSGYMHLQDNAGDLVRDYMMHGGNKDHVLEGMNRLYHESQGGHQL
jgi:multiple sugar transport system substrate-binding protein